MIISLLQVVNRLDASWFSRLFIQKFDASCFNNLKQVCKYQLATSLIFTDLLQLDEVNRLAGICWQLKQAGKIHYLHQVYGVSGWVLVMACEASDQTIRKFSRGFENCDAFRSCGDSSWNIKLDKTSDYWTRDFVFHENWSRKVCLSLPVFFCPNESQVFASLKKNCDEIWTNSNHSQVIASWWSNKAQVDTS